MQAKGSKYISNIAMTNDTTNLAPGTLVMRTLWGKMLSCQTVKSLGVETDILLEQSGKRSCSSIYYPIKGSGLAESSGKKDPVDNSPTL